MSRKGVEKVLSYNDACEGRKAKVLEDSKLRSETSKSCFLSPFIYQIEANPESACLHEEAFGPHVALIPFTHR